MSKTFLISIIFFLCSSAFSQDKIEFTDFEFNPEVRSVQLDGSFGIWSIKVGGAFDYDLFSNRNKRYSWFSLGTRLAADVILLSEFYGNYSPVIHYNTYARASIEGETIRLDLYGGGAYQTISKESTKAKNQFILKGGLDLKVKLSTFTGLLLNIGLSTGVSYFGIGTYLSFK